MRGDRVPEPLVTFDEVYADALTPLDRAMAVRRMVCTVPEAAGVDMAWAGEPEGPDRIVLHDPVNSVSNVIDGLIVPSGVGVGGRVLYTRRPHWAGDYLGRPEISGMFTLQAQAEQVRAMVAVPIMYQDRLLGVLYGANRYETEFGDRTIAALEQIAQRTATAQVVAERARHAAEVAMHEERRRVALELHDSVGAMLFTLGAGIRRLGAEPDLGPDIRRRLADMERQAAEATAALRGSLRALNAPPEQVALGVALREHCTAFARRTGIDARMLTLTELPVLSPAAIEALADTTREALLNVEKHAHARSVVISVFAAGSGVTVAISDDGQGPPAELGEHDGMGLESLGDRLGRIGGHLTILRNDDGGFTLQAWVLATSR
ncbi:GAF domain-containing protein [Nocardia sp. NEAU-G5]|uniref:GAF domain-containing protein n=1 Tax=Nocardia albiluteola TaxID=2842303 RepID=A0ABS6B6E0_9NOCA|nr:GAF domain-containing protein [Nocardia albiluteola]MBU3065325.1 GAF domain-containing protein [Nocardia albiluteola]